MTVDGTRARDAIADAQPITIFQIDTAAAAAGLDACEARCPRLSEPEIRRWANMDPRRAGPWRAAHIALRLVLERAGGVQFRRLPYDIGPAGRPSLPPPAPSFSLSHTAGLALVAVAPAAVGALGIDVAAQRHVTISPERRARLLAAGMAAADGRAADFIQAWTRLEAIGKALGRGVGPVLAALRPQRSGSDDAVTDDLLRLMGDAGIGVCDVVVSGGYRASLAAPQSILHLGPPIPLPTAAEDLEAFAAARMAIDLAGSAGQKER